VTFDYNDVAARARKGKAAFSNGSEYEMWEPAWCGRCLHDAPFRRMGKGIGCQILAAAVFEECIPAEWLEQPPESYPRDAYHCIEFKVPGQGGGEPRPQPDPPGMDGLFPRPERQTRMYVQPQPDHIEAVTP